MEGFIPGLRYIGFFASLRMTGVILNIVKDLGPSRNTKIVARVSLQA